MVRQFDKMHGLGNDFVIFDARREPLSVTEPLARAVADRRTGIGCDQLIVMEPSTVADLKMRIWNHDGGEVQSCGNASRCVVALTCAPRRLMDSLSDAYLTLQSQRPVRRRTSRSAIR